MAEWKEEVVISGIGGIFPECNNVDELKDLLFNKKNGVTIDSRRWKPNELGAMAGTGKLKNVDKFDATFFSAHPKLAEVMDAMTRLFIERSIEAIIDAGLSPLDLYGSNTAVFTGSAISETEMFSLDCSKTAAFSMLGRSRTMQANRVSYILNLIGPSFTMDGGWICGSNGLEKAKEMIENGIIKSAIVGVTNLVLRPEIQFQFQGLNRLNRGFHTKPFSSDADGYNRSEACIVMLLQKASEAKRSYGTLLSVKSMQFGDHEGHVTEHSGSHFKSLLLDTYNEANIDPTTVEYIEAYGSGILDDDSMELNVMEEVFCTKQRTTPLKVGSVKSNVGHCEASGLFMSIVKGIIALDTGYIPPNINYTKPNKNVSALKTKKIQVITEKTRLVSDVIGVSSFGILNAFSHVILKRNNKVKRNLKNISDDHCTHIPRLILASGRNEENVRETVNKIKSHGNDAEFIALTNGVFTKNINAHFYRSFSVFPNIDDSRIDDVKNVNLKKRPVWFIFSGMGSQWQGMGTHLMKLPIFAEAIDKCDTILKSRGVDIKDILTNMDPKLFDNILNSFVGIAAVQIGLVDVLKALDITPDGIIGHSVGELGCAYADGCFTVEEMILSAYARGRASLETEVIPGMMAAVGLGYQQIKDRLPHDVDVACHNSETSCTISGPVDSINAFVTELKSEGIFAKAVNVAGIAYHSRYIQSAGPTLLKYLNEVIKEPKIRSSKWVSSSLPATKLNSDLAKYSSPEYHTNNLLSSVLFEEAIKHIPSDAVTIEIAPHGLLQAIIRSALPNTVTNISLTKRMYGDSLRILLTAIGQMYTSGLNPKIQELYPKITYPVSRGTPSIQSLPFWEHSEQWTPVVSMNLQLYGFPGERTSALVLNDCIHLTEYTIHGKHIIPFSYVLVDVWKMFVEINAKTFSEEAIHFDNLRFKNNVEIHQTNSSESYLMIQWGSGLFEYNLDDEVILSGQISFSNHNNLTSKTEKSFTSNKCADNFEDFISKNEIYGILEKNGYKLGDNFKNVTNFNIYKNNIRGNVTWKNDWVYFLDGLLRIPLLKNLCTCHTKAPVSVRRISITPDVFKNNTEKNIYVNYNILTKELTCNGVKLSNVKYDMLTLTKLDPAVVKLEEQIFIQFDGSKCKDIDEFVYDTMDIIMEADKLNLDSTSIGKLVLCTPYHYDNPISKACTKLIKQIVENQLSINSTTMNWENVKNTTEYDETGRFVTVTNVDYLQDTIKCLANKKNSYIFVWSKQKLQDLKYWKIITQHKSNENSCYLVLMKKEILLDGNYVFIKPTNNDYRLGMWTALEKINSTKENVFIVSMSEPLENVNTCVKEILTRYKLKKLRFLFILDSNAPEFETNKSFYINQLSKGLIVNIYKNGGWGVYKRTVLEHLKNDNMVTKNIMLKNISDNGNNKLAVKYLGLNFKRLVVDNNTENEFGPLEYSGFYENHEKIMGIASLHHNMSSEIKYDTLLSWPVPPTWSLEDATTVPLAHAISYYVFNILCTLQKDKSVLVTSGLHPVGQAAIAICLAEKCQTYAVVESRQQAYQLSNIFPGLTCSSILINSSNNYDVRLKMMTESKGVDLILNFLGGEAFQAALRTIAKHGKFFHFSETDLRNYGHIGTRIFLQDASFSVVTSNLLLNESDHNKQIVQKAFMYGLNKGVIKPLPRFILPMSINSNKIFEAMRTAVVTSKRVVLPVKCNFGYSMSKEKSERETHQCHSDQIYIIIAHKSEWLDLAEWLVDRGAQKIVIAVKRCLMSSITCRRFDRLISRKVLIQIESDLYVNTSEEFANWLNRLTSSNVLGSIFIVNQFDDKKINNLRFAFEHHSNKTIESSFICISSKGKDICTELKSIGLNALNISWDKMSTQQNNISKLLLSLDTLLNKSNSRDSSSFVCSELGINKLEWSQQINDVIANFFPETIDELYALNDKLTTEAVFVEVPTRSPRYSQQKSVTPVFVIPGFKPKLIETFYRKFLYPVFEAQLPEDIGSIDTLSEILVNKLKDITDKGYVSLIGESWGGIVALKMAQILEAQGIMVTVALLEGDPEILTRLAESFLSNENITNKLNTIYNTFSNELSKFALQKYDGELELQNMSSYSKVFEENTQRALNIFRRRLQTLLMSKPLSNKLLTKVLIFRYQRTSEFNRTNLNDYCINPPFVHIISETDYKGMVLNKKMIEVITESVAYSYPIGIELTLQEKYNNFYFSAQKYLKGS